MRYIAAFPRLILIDIGFVNIPYKIALAVKYGGNIAVSGEKTVGPAIAEVFLVKLAVI